MGADWSGFSRPCGICLQIDLDFALGDHVSRLLVVFEIGAADLIEAGGIASIKSDLHIMQFGVAALLELHCFASLDGEQSAALFGLWRW